MMKHYLLVGICLYLATFLTVSHLEAQDIIGEWNLVEGTFNNAPITNLSASLSITGDQDTINYRANFNNEVHSGSVKANYTLDGNKFISNINGNSLILNGLSFESESSNGQFVTIWSASLSISLSVFNQWGATAIGFNEPTFNISGNTLTLTSANGNAELTYMREPVSSNEVGRSDPDYFTLTGNYPNPFIRETFFEFTLSQAAHIQLSIFNSFGQIVATIMNDKHQAGEHSVRWQPAGLSPGIYFYQMSVDKKTKISKLIIGN